MGYATDPCEYPVCHEAGNTDPYKKQPLSESEAYQREDHYCNAETKGQQVIPCELRNEGRRLWPSALPSLMRSLDQVNNAQNKDKYPNNLKDPD